LTSHTPLTQPPYPLASVRSGEEGALVLDVLVGNDGRVLDAKVSRSSGSARLDQAALNEAKAHWRLRPATRDGRPFEQWLTLRVVFRLENR
jgi:protein TonB